MCNDKWGITFSLAGLLGIILFGLSACSSLSKTENISSTEPFPETQITTDAKSTTDGPAHPGSLALDASVDKATRAKISESYGKLPLSFEMNQGQTDPEVKFLTRGIGYSLFFTPQEAVLALTKGKPESVDASGDDKKMSPVVQSSVVRMKLEGANPEPKVSGLNELPGKSNYLSGVVN